MNAPGVDRVRECRSAPWRSTPLPIVRCPATPTCPASVTPSSIVVLPAMPTCAASSTFRPIVTPCAIWTRLSILVPAPIRVSPTAGRSIAVLRADLDVVFDDDAADLRNLVVGAVRPPREAEAVAADDRAVLDDDAIARCGRARGSTRARGGRSRRRPAASRPITTCGWTIVRAPIRAPSPTTANGPTDASVAELHAVADARPAGGRPAPAASVGEQLDRPRERQVRLRVAQHRARRRPRRPRRG